MDYKLDILVVGGGMYVTGRGTDGDGTVLPALFEAHRQGFLGRIAIVTTSETSAIKNRKKVDSLAQRMGISPQCELFPKVGTSKTSFLKAAKEFKPDAVIVAVPDHLHSSISIPLIEMGLHCLVVKPMAPTLEEANSMVFAAEKAGVVSQVEFHKRLDESNLLLYENIRSGKLGKLLYAVIEYSQKKKVPRDIFRSWSSHSNIFQYLGVHYVDLLQFTTAFRPIKVSAWGQKDYLENLGIDTWDSMQVIIEWERKDSKPFVSTHITNWIDPDETSAMSDQKINVVGTKGRFQADQKHRGVQVVQDELGIQEINPYFCTSRKEPNTKLITFNGYGIKSILQFVNDVRMFLMKKIDLTELEKSRATFKVCKISSAVIEATNQSLKNKSLPVKVKI